MREKFEKIPPPLPKTDYKEMWSRAGKPFIDGGVSVVGGQPLSVSFRPALFLPFMGSVHCNCCIAQSPIK